MLPLAELERIKALMSMIDGEELDMRVIDLLLSLVPVLPPMVAREVMLMMGVDPDE